MGDKGGLLRWLLLGLVVFLTIQFVSGWGKDEGTELQPIAIDPIVVPEGEREKRPEPTACDLWSKDFRARIAANGAGLESFVLLTAKYRKAGEPLNLATTPDHETRHPLFVHFRNPAAGKPEDPKWAVRADTFTWTVDSADSKACKLSYRDERVRLEKVISVARPYELAMNTSIENVGKEKAAHALTVESTAWRYQHEVEGGMFRVSPFLTHVECVSGDGSANRLDPAAFEPADFQDPEFGQNALNRGDFWQSPKAIGYAAVSNAYFSQALIPAPGDAPKCQLQIEKRGTAKDGDLRGAFYRSRLAYAERWLEPGQKAEYHVGAYIGPKERDVLASAGGTAGGLSELIDLGFFSVIAKVLVAFLLKVHSVIPNWGIAIILLTVTARVLLFPLSVPMIKNSIEMRRLKPEMDALTAKFKDDPQQRGLAQMELWRKHGVSPFKGCLPQVASMPVWFALYTTLQTAVELYNIPFLWFPDLSESDPLYILPFIIGSTTFLQQKLMPQQGDPAQQKMLLYMMPGMFTVFMLFLPSGLGVYMFTNGLIAIGQQQLVERHVRRTMEKKKKGEITVREREKDEESPSQGGPDGKKKSKNDKRGKGDQAA